MAGIAWNRLKLTDWMAMAGAVLALVCLQKCVNPEIPLAKKKPGFVNLEKKRPKLIINFKELLQNKITKFDDCSQHL